MIAVFANLLLLLYGAPIVLSAACVIGENRQWPNLPRIAHAAVRFGMLAVLLGAVGMTAGVLATHNASAAPGLSAAEISSLRAKGFTEAGYALFFGLFAGLPGIYMGRRVLKDRR